MSAIIEEVEKELLEAMEDEEVLSAKELNERLEWNKTKLYRILGRLVAGGQLLKQDFQQIGKGRMEALFVKVTPEVPPEDIGQDQSLAELREQHWTGSCGRCLARARVENRWVCKPCFDDLEPMRLMDEMGPQERHAALLAEEAKRAVRRRQGQSSILGTEWI